MALYNEFFGLKESPFNLTPDPVYLFLSRSHEEALASLEYGIRHRRGFMMVTGEVGTGKTTICRALLARIGPDTDTSLILNPALSETELLSAIVHDFGVTKVSGQKGDLLEALNHFLLAGATRGRNAVLIIDEAQNLPPESLEAVRMVSNLETEKEKLIQIILAGQPELVRKLSLPTLRQMDQRISIRVRLERLDPDETRRYILHRLSVAGAPPGSVGFTPSAIRVIHRASLGFPRLINGICDRALTAAYAEGNRAVTPRLAKEAAREVIGVWGRRTRWRPAAALAACWSAFFMLGWWFGWSGLARKFVPGAASPVNQVGRPQAGRLPTGTGTAQAVPNVDPGTSTDAFSFEPGALVRTQDPAMTPLAALATLLRLFGLEYLARDATGWRVMNFDPRLLRVFFRGADITKQYHLGIILGTSLDGALKINAPFMVFLRGEKGESRYVVLAGAGGGSMAILDPIEGPRSMTRERLEKLMEGPPIFALPGVPGGRELMEGDRGSEVMRFQELLKAAGYFAGRPDGLFSRGTAMGVRKMQQDYGLPQTGTASGEAWMVAARAAGALSAPGLDRMAK